ncbi:hypothetical protein HZH66_000295 [Vespula vulgaris]|uniref:Uncharacterized protein n=1 Tax=Vespula vulgaris TaxID=7454 RepID=A0A834KNU3_VESVU|nr:hypothetical protein HZH66_000295 [Vespula vulgaris]
MSKSQPPGSSSREEQIALRLVKGQFDVTGRTTNRLPPPVIIRRKHIPLKSGKQQSSSIPDSSISDEGPQHVGPDSSDTSEQTRDRPKLRDRSRGGGGGGGGGGGRGGGGRERERGGGKGGEGGGGGGGGGRGGVVGSGRGGIGAGGESKRERNFPQDRLEQPRKRTLVSKSASTNGNARLFSGDTATISTSSSSYERDIQSFLSRPSESSTSSDVIRKESNVLSSSVKDSTTNHGIIGVGVGRVSDSTSSDLQEESELSSEERDALIEGTRTSLSVRRNRTTTGRIGSKFGARRRVVGSSMSSTSSTSFQQNRQHSSVVVGKSGSTTSATTAAAAAAAATCSILKSATAVVEILENDRNELRDIFPGEQEATSAPTTLSLGRKLSSWTKEGKELLVKSVSSANTLAPTTMTCIKSPRAMSEHLLGQLEVPVAPTVLGALRVKGGSLREAERTDKMTDVPRQRWSSVRVKGGSTKSLLLENGGPQPPPLKGALRKESNDINENGTIRKEDDPYENRFQELLDFVTAPIKETDEWH